MEIRYQIFSFEVWACFRIYWSRRHEEATLPYTNDDEVEISGNEGDVNGDGCGMQREDSRSITSIWADA